MAKWMCYISDHWHYVIEEKSTGICPEHGRVWWPRKK